VSRPYFVYKEFRLNLRPTLVVLVLLFAAFSSAASHIVGGNIHYELLGGDTYLIQLFVYRDCATSTTDFDDPASIGVYDSNGNLVENIEIDINNAEISDVPVDTGNQCLEPPEGICVKEAIFTTTVDLPPIPGGYTLAYQRCCRNVTLVNTESNDDLGITLYAQIPGSEVTTENSNPIFNDYPPLVICMNQPFVFDHSASDADGDELEYVFCNPLLSNVGGFYINPPGAPPYPELEFYPEFDYEYPITSDPGFEIDPATGVITGTPTQLGQYVVGICINEYRNGELIATMNRDFQFNVTLCDVDVIAAIPDQSNPCDGLTIDFENNSENAEWYFWDFGVEELQSDTSIEINPTYTFPDTGTYIITLIANPGLTCADTNFTTYTAGPSVHPEDILAEYNCIDDESYWNFSFTGEVDPESTILWDFGDDATPQESNATSPNNIQYIDGAGIQPITLTVTLGNCIIIEELEIDIPHEPEAWIIPQETFCEGMTYQFGNDSQHAEEYAWDFGYSNGADDQSNEEEPEVTFPEVGTYDVVLTASAENTCPSVVSLEFDIFGDLQPYFDNPGPECIEGNSFDLAALGASTDDAEYLWEFEDASIETANTMLVFDINYQSAGYFDVSLTITENGCTETYEDSLWVINAPQIGLDIQTAEGCPPLYVQFYDLSTSDVDLDYFWEFGDGQTSEQAEPLHVYMNPGTYDVTLTIASLTGCVTELTQTLDDAIWVYPEPSALLDVNPIHVTLLEPTIEIEDLSSGAIDCEYFISDGGHFDDCNGFYDMTQAGHHIVTQWVINEWGCTDSARHIVIVEGFLFYAPNSFTPNDDGINEVWFPVMNGVDTFLIQIYDRWGEVIFESTEPDKPWVGNVDNGDHYAQDGLYIYRVTLHDLLGYPHEFVGHVSLLR
jgi:gliding motility-associated-like protein